MNGTASPPTYWLQSHYQSQTAGIIHRSPYECKPSHDDGFHWHSFVHFEGVRLIRDGATLCGECFPHMVDFGRDER